MSHSLFKKLRKQYHTFHQLRSEVKKLADDVLSFSKQAIFSLHRDDFKKAKILLKQAQTNLREIEKKAKKEEALFYEGSYRAGREEFIEAKLFLQVLEEGKVGQIKEVKVSFADWLAGVCDLTGEILRKAVQLASSGNYKKVIEVKKIVEEIMAELIQFNLSGYLRSKYDAAKRNLKKLEEILYDIKIRKS